MNNFERWSAHVTDEHITSAKLYLAATCDNCPARDHCNKDDTTYHCLESFIHWAILPAEDEE